MNNPILESFSCDATLIGKNGNDDVYLWIRTERYGTTLLAAPCSGGAYNQFGSLQIENKALVLRLNTVKGIFTYKSILDVHRYELENFDFPLEEIKALINKAAINSQKAHRLKHKRMWARWSREHRND